MPRANADREFRVADARAARMQSGSVDPRAADALSEPASPQPPISIERFVVGKGRLSCMVRLAPGAPHLTSPELAARVAASFPDLSRHACVNEAGPTFGAVMARTPLPHLLEHLVIDLQTRQAPTDQAVYVGTTEWVDEAAGTARVQVSFTDDLVALRAFRDAVSFLNECVVG